MLSFALNAMELHGFDGNHDNFALIQFHRNIYK